MKKKKLHCCICGKEIEGYGNTPDGAIVGTTLKRAQWEQDQRCCNECNEKYVVPGRIALSQLKQVVETLSGDTVEDMKAQLRSLATNGDIDKDIYDCILANWDILVEDERHE